MEGLGNWHSISAYPVQVTNVVEEVSVARARTHTWYSTKGSNRTARSWKVAAHRMSISLETVLAWELRPVHTRL